MIAVDIGNTSISLALFSGKDIRGFLKLPTKEKNSFKLKNFLSANPKEDILVCSVVPRVTTSLKKIKRKVLVVGEDVFVPIKCAYVRDKVGMDRLVGAFAARKLFPSVRFILDFGTALTLEFLSLKGEYQGGIILPGIGSTLKTLSECALLPQKIEFKHVRKRIPKNTTESINKGIEEGFPLMVNSLIKKYRRELNLNPREKAVVTGGDAVLISSRFDFPYSYEPFLVLKGLNILYSLKNSDQL
ncbi:MAG: type III pantothenate kinase [Candidatus Omnitrophica bacterium]|nr:type III pantothenate kinase [Candidatus Omnitrophota bacterium]